MGLTINGDEHQPNVYEGQKGYKLVFFSYLSEINAHLDLGIKASSGRGRRAKKVIGESKIPGTS